MANSVVGINEQLHERDYVKLVGPRGSAGKLMTNGDDSDDDDDRVVGYIPRCAST